MNFLLPISENQPIAWAVVILSTVAVCGLAIAKWKVRGVGVGIAGVLFAGLVAGDFGVQIDRGRANARAPLGPAVTSEGE